MANRYNPHSFTPCFSLLSLLNQIMVYENGEYFDVIPSIEDENNPFVRLSCRRHLYTARRSNYKREQLSSCNEIDHELKDYWSTFWLDVVFNSDIRNPLVQGKHLLYNLDPPYAEPTDFIEDYYTAIPSLLYQGYWEIQGKRNELYFYASVCEYYGCKLFVPYFIKLTDIEVVRLQERIAFNEMCKRRVDIYEFLLREY